MFFIIIDVRGFFKKIGRIMNDNARSFNITLFL
jgi:hypothetical protein